jgi:hypothetical protein
MAKIYTEQEKIEFGFNAWKEVIGEYYPQFTMDDEISWLKENCDDIQLVKKIFDEQYYDYGGYYSHYYDIEKDKIISFCDEEEEEEDEEEEKEEE